jgi:hypothetical protein
MVSRLKLPTSLGWRFGFLVLLLAVFSLLLGTQNAINVNDNTRCLAKYAQRNAEVSKTRAEAARENDVAVNEFLDRVTDLIVHPPPDPVRAQKRLKAAAEKRKRANAELQAKRATNPLPDFPQQCREINR